MALLKTTHSYPLSSPQINIWFDQILHPDVPLYNIGGYVRIDGPIDPTIFEKALNQVITDNDALRIIIHEGESLPTQTFAENVHIKLDFYDFSDKENTEKQTIEWMQREFVKPFPLYDELLFQFALIKTSANCYYWFGKYHHLIMDGWSISLDVQRVATAYNALLAGQSKFEQKHYSYLDFVKNDQAYLDSDKFTQHERYWREKFHELPEPLIHRRYAKGQTIPSKRSTLTLARPFYNQLMTFAQNHHVSTFHLIIGALYCYFVRISGTEEFVIGLSTLNRKSGAFKQTLGMFTNVIPAKFRFSLDLSIVQLLQAIRKELQKDYRYQRFPINRQPKRHKIARKQLFDLTLSYAKHDHDTYFNGHPTRAVYLANGFEQNALAIFIEEFHQDEDVNIYFDYSLGAFETAEIELLKARFKFMLSEILHKPHVPIKEVQILPEAELNRIMFEFNDTATDYPDDKTIVDLFEEQVEKTSDNIAIVFENQSLSYQELNRRANQVAHHLQTLGVKPEMLVGICVERSLEMVIGLIGILKAGGAYLPLDPLYPKARLAFMLEDAGVPVLLTQTSLKENLPTLQTVVVFYLDKDWEMNSQQGYENIESGVQSDNLAYVIYTSGSTGKPKGVLVEHRGLCNLAKAQIQRFNVQPDSRVLQFASLSFDASISEIVMALCSGATLCLGTAESLLPGPDLIQQLREQTITHVTLPPTALAVLPTEELLGLQHLIVAGEACPPDLAAQWSQGRYFFNAYGPTESTVCATVFEYTVVSASRLPIGRPIANIQIYILDRHLQPMPIGMEGELHIGGVGLARGYLNRPELTQEKFIPNPFSKEPGARLYKTGDLARYLPDGHIEYLGRLDNRVKIRGFRIELGEIETVLATHPKVRQAVVLVWEVHPNDKRLVAYIIPTQEPAPTELHHFLEERLPNYMVPASFIVLTQIPLTPNGKVDRHALPTPVPFQRVLEEVFVAPRTQTEKTLAVLWADILEQENIGIHDNFFELGGHSLLAVTLMNKIQQQFGKALPIATLFKGPTIEQLANLIEQKTVDGSPLVAIQTGGNRLPFFCIHPVGGNVFCYTDLAHHLGAEQPFYGLQSLGLNGEQNPLTSIEEMATRYIEILQTIQPQAPYQLGGWSFGGVVAFEMAQQLHQQGQEVALLALIDSYAPSVIRLPAEMEETSMIAFLARDMGGIFGKDLLISVDEMPSNPYEQLDYVLEQAKKSNILPPDMAGQQMRQLLQVFKANSQAMSRYQPRRYPGKVTLFCASEPAVEFIPSNGWNEFIAGSIEIHTIQGDHYAILRKPHVSVLAEKLGTYLNQSHKTAKEKKGWKI